MADATLSSKQFVVWGNKRAVLGAMLLSGAHGANGFGCTAGQLGLTKVDAIAFIPTATGDEWVPTYSAGYVALLIASQASACTAGASISAIFNFIALGV